MKHLYLYIVLLILMGTTWSQAEDTGSSNHFRVGVSGIAIENQGANSNDSAAALKAWSLALVQEQNLDIKTEMIVYRNFEEMKEAFLQNQLDAASMNIEELLRLDVRPESIYLPSMESGVFIRYGIVVHKNSGSHQLAQLIGQKVVTHKGSRMALSHPWLQTIYAKENNGQLTPEFDKFLEDMSRADNPSKAIFQVFFGQVQAALIDLDAFDLACELNPQLRRDIVVLHQSPPLVTDLFMFNPLYQTPTAALLQSFLGNLHTTTRGKQLLTIFQCNKMVLQPISILKTSEQLLEQYQNLRRQNSDQGGHS